jgi:pimeloyl-ACP methyl ester carboxylesterase
MTRDLLLIHGAWQGAWVWDLLIPHLTPRGWHCHAADLPENGQPGAPAGRASLPSYVAHCAAVMPARVIVVAHSGAGVIASQLAELFPDRIAGVVYLTGMMLPSGMAFGDLLAGEDAATQGIGPYLVWSKDGAFSSVPTDAARDIFLQDCAPDIVRMAAEKLRPQRETGRRLVAQLTPERFGRVRRVYVEARLDRSVVLAMQQRMQALVPGARVLSIATGHAPQLSQPEALAHLLDEALVDF